MTRTDLAQSPEEFLHDCIREARAKRDAIQPRGFDSIKARALLDAEIDEYLEDLFELIRDETPLAGDE